jgi:hypothetical protein
MRRLILILILFSAICLHSVGAFNAFNGRNHSELVWRMLETEHYVVVYHDPLQSCAQAAADVCEASYAALSKTYQVEPKEKIPVYISDQDEIANGATVFTWYVFVWVNQNDYIHFLSGDRKWLETVLAHELSHYFSFVAIRDWSSALAPITTGTFPRDFAEGYAQFFSGEPWGHNRGDTYLRRAVLSGDPGIDSKYGDWGGLVYAQGFACVRYLETKYGEDKLIELLKYRNKAYLYNFNDAFNKVYGMSPNEFYKEWRRFINTYYFGDAYKVGVGEDTLCIATQRTLKTSFGKIDRLIVQGDRMLFLGRSDERQGFQNLTLGTLNPDSLKTGKAIFEHRRLIVRAGGFTGISLSPDGRYVAWSRYLRGDYGSVWNAVFRFDTLSGHTERVGWGEDPVVTDNGVVYYHRLGRGAHPIYRWVDGREETWLDFSGDVQLGGLALSPDGTKITLVVFGDDRIFRLQIRNLSDTAVTGEKSFPAMPIQVFWTTDGHPGAMEESPADQRRVLWTERDGVWIPFHTPAYNLTPVSVEPDNNRLNLLSLAEMDRDKPNLLQITLWPEQSPESIEPPKPDYFNSWTMVRPHNAVVLPDSSVATRDAGRYRSAKFFRRRMTFGYPINSGVFATALWSEPLGRHLFGLAGLIPYSFDDEYYTYAYYQNRCFRPTITLTEYSTKWLGGIWEEKEFYEFMHEASLSAVYPLDWIDAPFWSLNAGALLEYHHYCLSDDKNLSSRPYYDDGDAIGAGAVAQLAYNMPYRNAAVHPVREFNLSGQYTTGGMSRADADAYTTREASLEAAWAPLFDTRLPYLARMISLRSLNFHEGTTGDYFVQNNPGLDRSSRLEIAGNPFFHRRYLRGRPSDWICSSLTLQSDEIWIKFIDDLNFTAGFSGSLLHVGYVGAGGWFDYARLTDAFWKDRPTHDIIEYRTVGFEGRAVTHVMGLPFVNHVGRAFETDGSPRGWYYLLDLSLGL